MATDRFSRMQRRAFLKLTGAMAAFRLTPPVLAVPSHRISVVIDDSDPIACSDPVHWAAGQLQSALLAKGFLCDIAPSSDQRKDSTFSIAVGGGAASSLARNFPLAGTASALRRVFASFRIFGRRTGNPGLRQRPTRIHLRVVGVGRAGSILA